MRLAGSNGLVIIQQLALQVAEAEAEEQERAAQLAEQAKTVAAVTRDAALARWRRLKVGQGWKYTGHGGIDTVHAAAREAAIAQWRPPFKFEAKAPTLFAAQTLLAQEA